MNLRTTALEAWKFETLKYFRCMCTRYFSAISLVQCFATTQGPSNANKCGCFIVGVFRLEQRLYLISFIARFKFLRTKVTLLFILIRRRKACHFMVSLCSFEVARICKLKFPHKGTLNNTKTSLGRSLMRTWLLRPSLSLPVINARLNAVACFLNPENLVPASVMHNHLKGIKNVPRILGLLKTGKAKLSDWQGLVKVSYFSVFWNLTNPFASSSPFTRQCFETT